MRRGWIVLAGVISAGAYLAFALARNGDFGWPLDDAWIHQVYARNLGLRGEFSFFAGQPSAGSTSPLWALVLSPGYWPGMDYRVWTVALGVLLLGGSAWLAGKMANRVGERLNPGVTAAHTALWTIVLMLGEWHLAWASVSGMEVLLFIFLELALIELFLARANPIVLGALAGLLGGIVIQALVVPECIVGIKGDQVELGHKNLHEETRMNTNEHAELCNQRISRYQRDLCKAGETHQPTFALCEAREDAGIPLLL